MTLLSWFSSFSECFFFVPFFPLLSLPIKINTPQFQSKWKGEFNISASVLKTKRPYNVLFFVVEGEKRVTLRKTIDVQREPTTNATHVGQQVMESNPAGVHHRLPAC